MTHTTQNEECTFKEEIHAIFASTCANQGKCGLCDNNTQHVINKIRQIIKETIPEELDGDYKIVRKQLLITFK